jgi:hypothetical protein
LRAVRLRRFELERRDQLDPRRLELAAQDQRIAEVVADPRRGRLEIARAAQPRDRRLEIALSALISASPRHAARPPR